MKISIAVSLLILAAAAGLGWHDHKRLEEVRTSHGKLVAEAAKLGIVVNSPGTADEPVRITKHEREDREADARKAAAEFIAFAKEMEAMEKKGGPPDEATQKRIMEFMDRMMSLDASQLKILVAEIRASKDLKDESRKGLIGFSIMTLANDHPQAALALYTESSDLFTDDGMGKHVISSSLAKWAKDDPMGALDWVRKNGEKYPDLVTDDAKRGLISGAAIQDPKLAFSLIDELGLKNSDNAVTGIINAAKTPAERTATLSAFREYLGAIKDEKARAEATGNGLGMFANSVTRDGFEAGTKWLASANLTPSELEGFIGGLTGYSTKSSETGQWIEWMGTALPEEKSNKQIGNIVRNWTQNDYQAAGKWLAATPEGPTKHAAVRSYAETVSRYEPETAAQWAMTLPPGDSRDETLKRIHDNWPKDDPASKHAAEAFAKEHNIK
jgi:hypothetical protein